MKTLNCLTWLNCRKCGAINYGASKHKPVYANGKVWCGHCGGNLKKDNK